MMARADVRKCPVCGKTPDAVHRPFCSERCAKIDLGRWLGEAYTVPVEETPPLADDSESCS